LTSPRIRAGLIRPSQDRTGVAGDVAFTRVPNRVVLAPATRAPPNKGDKTLEF
jgi:hypothetical protein